jgi:hypothetical protein
MTLEVEVPPNTSAMVVRPGLDGDHLDLQAGRHSWSYAVPDSVADIWAEQTFPNP